MTLQAEVETEFPESEVAQELLASGLFLSTPLLREGVPIGVIHDSPHGGSSFFR